MPPNTRFDIGALVGGFVKDVQDVTDLAMGYRDAKEPRRPFTVVAGTAGDIAFKTMAGTELTRTVAAGDELRHGTVPMLVQEILAAGTTVTAVSVGYVWI